ncbi:MAG: hypothetical protein J5I53_01255 [Bradyrhizobiaceae bacterium]|nr:hypothetical protein [Bradyrhizobiaceae bacterium]
MAKTAQTKKQKVSWVHPWTSKQFMYLGIGIAVIIVGFLLLATGVGSGWDNPLAVNVAPVVLVIGYCVVVPWAIMSGSKKSDQQ